MQVGGARWSLGGPGWSLGAARGLPGGFRAQNECLKKWRKSHFAPWCQDGWVLGVPALHYSEESAPCGAGLARKVLLDDNLSPFSSDKIRAKILDLGYGGARRALHNLSPKSARILSAAITRTPLPPAGVRIGPPRKG